MEQKSIEKFNANGPQWKSTNQLTEESKRYLSHIFGVISKEMSVWTLSCCILPIMRQSVCLEQQNRSCVSCRISRGELRVVKQQPSEARVRSLVANSMRRGYVYQALHIKMIKLQNARSNRAIWLSELCWNLLALVQGKSESFDNTRSLATAN